MTKKRLGELYQDLLEYFATRIDNPSADQSTVKEFIAGFVTGQAEKICLGVCDAAMIKPDPTYRTIASDIVQHVADTYNLANYILVTSSGDEFWFYAEDAGVYDKLILLEDIKENSPSWHLIRGQLCGIPKDKIDPHYRRPNEPKPIKELADADETGDV